MILKIKYSFDCLNESACHYKLVLNSKPNYIRKGIAGVTHI